jgi:hypothetical protein
MTTSGVTIYTSLRGVITSLISPTILLGLGIFGLTAGSANAVALVLTVLGALLALVTLLDYPQRVEFHETGIDRVCLLRRHRLRWEDVRAIERARGTLLSYVRLRNAGDEPTAPRAPSGGLVARGPKGRRWLLCDRIESQPEFDAIKAEIASRADWVAIAAARPSPTTPPTTLYRRGVDNPMDG